MAATRTIKTELMRAVEFVKQAAPDGGVLSLAQGVASVVTPYMRAYYPILEDMTVTTDIDKFHAAIKAIGDRPYSATVTKTLKLNAGSFRCELPVMEIEKIYPITPEQVNVAVQPAFFEALFAAASVTSPGADRVAFAGVYLSDQQTCVGTDGRVILEVWHGCADLAYGVIIPTDFIKILQRVIGWGYNPTHAITDDKFFAVKFDGDCILMTNNYAEQFPDYKTIFSATSELKCSSDGLDAIKSALDEVAPFGDYFEVGDGAVECGNAIVTNAAFKNDDWSIAKKDWYKVAKYIEAYNAKLPNMVFFTNRSPWLRGLIVKLKSENRYAIRQSNADEA